MAFLWTLEKQSRVLASVAVLSVVLAIVAGCGDNNSGGGAPAPVAPAMGTVSGKVVSSANSSPVSGATVKTSTGTATTVADGKFTVAAPVGDRSILHVEATGFAESFPVARVTSGQTTTIGVKLVPIGVTATVSVAAGDTVSVPNSSARVTIPANGLVPQAGGTPLGSVNVSLTPINPTVDPNLMPGGFNGISAGGGTTQPIESFGAMLVDIKDSAGTRYTLAGGKTSTIRIPLGTQSTNPPSTIPLWFFDETAGVWKEEGTATLQGTVPNQYYEGTVNHFSYWNADQVLDSIFVTGCVRDAIEQPVASVIVRTEGIDYTGEATGVTAADGTFRVAMRKSSRAKLGLFEFDLQTFNFVPISNTVNVGPSTTDIALLNCLVKKAGPLSITTSALSGGNVAATYNQTLAAAGGVPGYVWSLNTGSNPLPAGLELNSSGVITGTPTTAGTTTIIIKVTDSAGETATKEFTLTINPSGVQPLVITTSALPAGMQGTTYNATLTATGGDGAKSWSISTGTLPTGLRLDAATGVISGTPETPATSLITAQVRDSGVPQQSAERQLTIVILPSGGGGGGGGSGSGTLTVTGAPASVGGTFVVDGRLTSTSTVVVGGVFAISWIEALTTTPPHAEGLTLESGESPAGPVLSAVFVESDIATTTRGWVCARVGSTGQQCNGLTISRTAGTATFSNVVLIDPVNNTSSITLNGTLTFTPF